MAHLFKQLPEVLQPPGQFAGHLRGLLLECRADLLGLFNRRRRCLKQLAIGLLERLVSLLTPPMVALFNAIDLPAGAARAVTEGFAAKLGDAGQDGLGSLEQARDHAHAIAQQGAVARMMDVGLNDRAIDTQFTPTRHLQLTGEGDDMIKELMQGIRRDEIGPAHEGRIIGNRFQIDPTELAQD